jgi:hypothetical protein
MTDKVTPVRACREEEDDTQLGEEESQEEKVVRDQGPDEGGGARDRVRHERRDGEADEHPSVDGAEEGRDALRGSGRGRECWRSVERFHWVPP